MPIELVTVAKSSKKKGAPYSVTKMSTEDFIDWEKLSELMFKNYSVNDKEESVHEKNVKKESPNK